MWNTNANKVRIYNFNVDNNSWVNNIDKSSDFIIKESCYKC